MIAIVAAILSQQPAQAVPEVAIDLKKKVPTVVLQLEKSSEGNQAFESPVASLSRRQIRSHGGKFEMPIVFDRSQIAVQKDGKLTIALELVRPGFYEIHLGLRSIMVAISRTDKEFRTWENDIALLQRIAGDLLMLAQTIDGSGDLSQGTVQSFRKQMDDMRGRMYGSRGVNLAFPASVEELEGRITRLYHHRKLVKGATVPDTTPQYPGGRGDADKKAEKEDPFKRKSAVEEARGADLVVAREAVLSLLDELEVILLSPPEVQKEKKLTCILRWSDAKDGFRAILEGLRSVRGYDEVRKFVEQVRDGKEEKPLDRMLEVRASLLKIPSGD